MHVGALVHLHVIMRSDGLPTSGKHGCTAPCCSLPVFCRRRSHLAPAVCMIVVQRRRAKWAQHVDNKVEQSAMCCGHDGPLIAHQRPTKACRACCGHWLEQAGLLVVQSSGAGAVTMLRKAAAAGVPARITAQARGRLIRRRRTCSSSAAARKPMATKLRMPSMLPTVRAIRKQICIMQAEQAMHQVPPQSTAELASLT